MLQFLLYFVLNKCSLSKTKVQNINNKCGVWKIALLMMYSHMKYSSVGAAVIVPVDFYLVQCIALSAGFFCLFVFLTAARAGFQDLPSSPVRQLIKGPVSSVSS